MSKLIVWLYYYFLTMWYFIAGRLMSSLTLLVLYKSLQSIGYLPMFDLSVGWFLIDHVFEEYGLTAGKLFLINNDYRTLITNLILILRNFYLFAQLITFSEFLAINSVLIVIYVSLKKTPFNYITKFFVILGYSFLFRSFFFLHSPFLYLFVKNMFIILLSLSTLMLYIFILDWFLGLNKNKIKQVIQIVICKISVYFFFTVFIVIGCLFLLAGLIKNQENVIHELNFYVLIPYSYIYYYLFVFK